MSYEGHLMSFAIGQLLPLGQGNYQVLQSCVMSLMTKMVIINLRISFDIM